MTKETEGILKTYWKMHKEMQKEKQFNRKIEKKQAVNKYQHENGLIISPAGCPPECNIYKENTIVAKIRNNYSSRRIELEYKVLSQKLILCNQ